MLLFHYKLHNIQKVYSREGGSNKATPKSQKRVSPASQYSFRAYSAEGKEETLFGGSDYKMDFLGRFGRILKKAKANDKSVFLRSYVEQKQWKCSKKDITGCLLPEYYAGKNAFISI